MTPATDTAPQTDLDLRDLILGLDRKIQRLDQKVDVIAADVVEIKIAQARTEERFNTIDERFNSMGLRMDNLETQFKTQDSRLEERFKAQDNRLWSLIIGVVLALFGLLAKMAFFPGTL